MAPSVIDIFIGAAQQVGTSFGKAFRSAAGKENPPVPEIHVDMKDSKQGGGIMAITCPNCNASVRLPDGKTSGYCAYCGTQLVYDDGSVTVTYRTVDEVELRKTEAEAALKLRQLEIEEQRRPGRLRLMAILALVGAAMMLIGMFAGSASGDPNSPWYMVEMLGFFPLISVAYIWVSMQRKS